MTSVVLKGVELDWRRARRSIDQVNRAKKNIVTAGGYELLARANETVPYEDGELLASGFVEVDEDGNVVVAYSAPYALRQHEVPMQHGGKGRWKWLELTAQERDAQRAVGEEMAREIEGAID